MVEKMRHWASVNHIKDQLARLEDGPLHAPVICSLQKSEREQENPFDSHLIQNHEMNMQLDAQVTLGNQKLHLAIRTEDNSAERLQ